MLMWFYTEGAAFKKLIICIRRFLWLRRHVHSDTFS